MTDKTWMSADRMLGLAGGGMAAVSLGFGLYMTVHGPGSAGLGHSRDFTVFAQLAPRQPAGPSRAHPAATTDDGLDTTATASVPKATDPASPDRATAETAIIPAMTLQDATLDAATIEVGGRVRTVRLGDTVPGAGEVLEIRTAPRAVVRTSRGLIVGARQD